jgi:hypothetical protein
MGPNLNLMDHQEGKSLWDWLGCLLICCSLETLPHTSQYTLSSFTFKQQRNTLDTKSCKQWLRLGETKELPHPYQRTFFALSPQLKRDPFHISSNFPVKRFSRLFSQTCQFQNITNTKASAYSLTQRLGLAALPGVLPFGLSRPQIKHWTGTWCTNACYTARRNSSARLTQLDSEPTLDRYLQHHRLKGEIKY